MGATEELRAALAANDAFYRAFAGGDAAAMDALWATTAPVLCIHPGGLPLHGREAVMASWSEILGSPPPIRTDSSEVTMVRGLAVVTCLELIGEEALCASNVFVWEDGAWRLVHHQAGGVHPDNLPSVAAGGHLH